MKSKKYEHLKLEHQICHRLYVASNSLTRAYRPLLDQLGISYPQYVIMMALWEEDGITLGELSQRSKLDKGFLTTLLSKLIEKKVISVRPSKEDRRSKLVYLLAKGERMREEASDIPQRLICQYDVGEEFDYEELKFLLDQIIQGKKE